MTENACNIDCIKWKIMKKLIIDLNLMTKQLKLRFVNCYLARVANIYVLTKLVQKRSREVKILNFKINCPHILLKTVEN